MSKAIVREAVYIPRRLISAGQLRDDLTVSQYYTATQETLEIQAFYESDGHYVVPRDYGLKLIAKSKLPFVDRRTEGTKVAFPKKVRHEGDYEYQRGFVQKIIEETRVRSDFLVRAATGKGKTVCSLSVAEKLGRTTLVVVDQENLRDQWREEAKAHLGLTDEQIGTIQGPKCDYEGKPLVIAMLQTLTQKDYPDEVYDYFGLVIFDEVHSVPAPTFSRALMLFSAATRIGISATIDRRDSLQTLMHLSLGNIAVSLLDKHRKSYVYYIESDSVYSWYANISPKNGRMLLEVSEDARRNDTIIEALLSLYDSGRDILVVSDRVGHLESLLAMAYYAGIPEEDLGLYCGKYNLWTYAKDPTPKRRPEYYETGAAYTPVKVMALEKKAQRAKLKTVKETSRIVFATFSMFTKGVDEPRLSSGIDCTPRSRAEQVHGRILREKNGKHVPIWVTIRDINSYKLEHQFLKRIDEYISSSAEIYRWKLNKGVRSVDVRELKRQVRARIKELQKCQIETSAGGRYMLVTKSMQSASGELPAVPTVKKTRYSKAF